MCLYQSMYSKLVFAESFVNRSQHSTPCLVRPSLNHSQHSLYPGSSRFTFLALYSCNLAVRGTKQREAYGFVTTWIMISMLLKGIHWSVLWLDTRGVFSTWVAMAKWHWFQLQRKQVQGRAVQCSAVQYSVLSCIFAIGSHQTTRMKCSASWCHQTTTPFI